MAEGGFLGPPLLLERGAGIFLWYRVCEAWPACAVFWFVVRVAEVVLGAFIGPSRHQGADPHHRGGSGVRVFSIVIMVCVLALVGCASGGPVQKTPSWVVDPSGAGGVAGVGSCRRHINGFSAQRMVAIRRGLDEIAMQKGTTISNVALVGTTGSRAGASTRLESWSFQTVDNQTVTAVVKASWMDPETEELFVWVVSN